MTPNAIGILTVLFFSISFLIVGIRSNDYWRHIFNLGSYFFDMFVIAVMMNWIVDYYEDVYHIYFNPMNTAIWDPIVNTHNGAIAHPPSLLLGALLGFVTWSLMGKTWELYERYEKWADEATAPAGNNDSSAPGRELVSHHDPESV